MGQVLDLEVIELRWRNHAAERYSGAEARASAADVPALVAEVRRLQADLEKVSVEAWGEGVEDQIAATEASGEAALTRARDEKLIQVETARNDAVRALEVLRHGGREITSNDIDDVATILSSSMFPAGESPWPEVPRPSQALPEATSVAPVAVHVDHSKHGRVTAEDTPNMSHCPCLGGVLTEECYEAGCGYCATTVRPHVTRRRSVEREVIARVRSMVGALDGQATDDAVQRVVDERAWIYNLTVGPNVPADQREHVDTILTAERERLDAYRRRATAAEAEVERLRLLYQQCAHCKASLQEPEGPPYCTDCRVTDEEHSVWEDECEALQKRATEALRTASARKEGT